MIRLMGDLRDRVCNYFFFLLWSGNINGGNDFKSLVVKKDLKKKKSGEILISNEMKLCW